MEETWKPIPGYEGLYDASSLGRIRSTPGKTTSSARFEKRVWKSRILKPKIQKTGGRGDYRVSLWKDGQQKDHLVSRLVASAWHGVPEDGLTVNHINGDFQDNRPENLEWVTLKENIRHAFRTGLMGTEKETTLISPEGEVIKFRSRVEASKFLGHNEKYISDRIIKGYHDAISSITGTRFSLAN